MTTTRWNVSEIGQARVLRGYLQHRIVLEVPSADPNKRRLSREHAYQHLPRIIGGVLGVDIHYCIDLPKLD